ncbi:MAG: TonB-dependent receptor, partial [Bacteroidota bacterium]
MKRFNVLLVIISFALSVQLFAQQANREATIYGHILDGNGEHIPFATVSITGTTLGTTTDAGGHFRLMGLADGMFVVKAQSLGYKPQQVEVVLSPRESKEVNFTLQSDALGLEEVVITSDRNETNRANASTIVNTLTAKMFATTESLTLSDGLNFCPGLRMENNCQNCGFSQVRMNGMEGPYSQVLINSRPIFSGLAGVYGLELIPSNMIERIEVVRGGGSALYGSNAIAGTINLILKDPISNSWEFGVNAGSIGAGTNQAGGPSGDLNVKFNSSLVTEDHKSGMAIYGFYRNRDPYDANDDGFSEISSMKNTTIGSRMYHRFGTRSKISLDFFNIKENRRGGDRHDYPMHESNITEAVDHNITTAALSFEQYIRETDRLSLYASAQNVDRDSYYGAEQSLSDYGKTTDLSYVTGAQYTYNFDKSSIVAGIENQGAWLKDKKLGYPAIDNAVIDFSDSSIIIPHRPNVLVADQMTNTSGAFFQYEINLQRLKISAGARYDHYIVKDRESLSDKTGDVFSPRLTMKYDLKPYLQARLSYSQGYRAPQIFDEDLHIETSGSRQVIHRNAPDLKQETSHSYMASLDFNRQLGTTYV